MHQLVNELDDAGIRPPKEAEGGEDDEDDEENWESEDDDGCDVEMGP